MWAGPQLARQVHPAVRHLGLDAERPLFGSSSLRSTQIGLPLSARKANTLLGESP